MSTTPETYSDKPHIPAAALTLADEAKQLLDDAQQFTVASDPEYEIAGTDLKRIKDKMRALDDMRKSITRPIDAAKKAVMDFFRAPEDFLKSAESTYKRSMLAYQQDQERKRREEEARIRELQRQEQERLAKEAEVAEKAGDKETAEAIIQQAAEMPTAIVPRRDPPKVAGVKTQTRWSAEVTDQMMLIKAVAAGQVPMIAIEINQRFLNQQAVSLKGALNIPGVKAVSKEGIAA